MKTGGVSMLTIEQIAEAARIVAKEYPITKMKLFGSYADGRNTAQSDVDVLVEFNTSSISLIKLCGIKNRMEELLNTVVDVVHSPIPDDSIIEINKVVPLYAA